MWPTCTYIRTLRQQIPHLKPRTRGQAAPSYLFVHAPDCQEPAVSCMHVYSVTSYITKSPCRYFRWHSVQMSLVLYSLTRSGSWKWSGTHWTLKVMTIVILDAVSRVIGFIAEMNILLWLLGYACCSPVVVMLLQLSCGVFTFGSCSCHALMFLCTCRTWSSPKQQSVAVCYTWQWVLANWGECEWALAPFPGSPC